MASRANPGTAADATEAGWIVAIQAVGGATIPEASVTPGHLDALDGSVPSNEFVGFVRASDRSRPPAERPAGHSGAASSAGASGGGSGGGHVEVAALSRPELAGELGRLPEEDGRDVDAAPAGAEDEM